MARILEDRENHATVLTDDGEVEIISWSSDRNVLIYKHDLEGLLVEGTDIVTMDTEYGPLTITPQDQASRFHIEVGDTETTVAPHEKTELIEALRKVYDDSEDGLNTEALIEYVRDKLDTVVDPNLADKFLAIPHLAEHVEPTDEGWHINDIVLLTYDNELYQPETRRTKRSGEVVEGGANKLAYDVRFERMEKPDAGQSALDSFESVAVTASEDVVEFLSLALWAIEYVSEGVEPN